jgi:hypothetical protein
MGRGLPPGGPGDFAFVGGEFGIANQIVAGAPYTAEAVTQFTQTLADGNKIQRTITASVARDSEGRTRTERTLQAIGPLTASGTSSPLKTVFVNDPVAGVSYMLNPNNHTFRQMPVLFRGGGGGGRRGPALFRQELAGSAPRARANGTPKTEDLGTQTIQGLAAQGKRITRTIPAGAVGNQRAINIVTEVWYSPDLQTIVLSKTSDPRFGETVYQLTNINRAEPDHSLFTVPQQYTLEQRRAHRGAARAE